MTSRLKIEANRRNAKRSTGPKSKLGQTQASRNARRHGLNVPIAANPSLSQQAKDLAQEMAAGNEGPDALSAAERVAEAQVDLARVRKVKDEVMAMLARTLNGPKVSHHDLTKTAGPAACADVFAMLERVERYERRAFSRRRKALRHWEITSLTPGR